MKLINWCQTRNKLSLALISIFVAVIVILSSCVAISPPSSTSPAPESTTSPAQTSEAESTQTIEPKSIPLNIRLDYIGIENAYGGNVQLVVVVSDGDKIEKHSIPRDDEYYTMDNFEVKKIERRVFHTAALKDNLKINILAYHRDQLKKTNLELINMMEWYYGDSINMLKNLVLNMPENDKLIGEYERTWYSDESLDIGQYYEVCGDLHVWFSIWSNTEPVSVPEPTLLPDVRIQSVILPSNAKKRGEYETWVINTYYTTLRLVNNESVDITVDWQGHSSVSRIFDVGSITIPKKSSISIKKDYYYEVAGEQEITYKIFYRGIELDSWSGTLNIAP